MSVELKDPRARRAPKYRRPALLDRLPRTPVATPTFSAIAAASIVLYGLAFAVFWRGVLNGRKAQQAERHTNATALALNSSTGSNPTQPPPPPVVTPTQPQPAAPASAPVQPPPPPPQPPPPVVRTEPPKPVEPRPVDKGPTQVAVFNPAPAPAPNPAPVEPPKPALLKTGAGFELLGTFVDPNTAKAQLTKDARNLALTLPGKLRILNPVLNLSTAPRVLTAFEGDFDVQVKVMGPIKPGSDAVKEAGLVSDGWAFNGQGLLVWQDAGNYLRLERTSRTKNGRNFFPGILVEFCKGGQIADGSYADVPEGPVILRIERRGGELKCLYNLEGQPSQEIKKLGTEFSPKVEVGVSAASTSRKSFPAKFEDFDLSRPGERK